MITVGFVNKIKGLIPDQWKNYMRFSNKKKNHHLKNSTGIPLKAEMKTGKQL